MDSELWTIDANGEVIPNPYYITEYIYHPRAAALGAAGVLAELREKVDGELEVILGEKDTTEFPEDS